MRNVNYNVGKQVAINTNAIANVKPTLHFNMLRMEWPQGNVTQYFSLSETDGSRKLYKSAFPPELSSIFSIEELETDFIYTTYGRKQEGYTPVSINIRTTNLEFARIYFRNKLKWYFKTKAGTVVENGFIDNIIVWVFTEDRPKEERFVLFQKFSIRVILENQKQDKPCLLISSEGNGKIWKENLISVFKNVSHTIITKVRFGNSVQSYSDYSKRPDRDNIVCFPVINANLAQAYSLPLPENKPDNKYIRYHEKIMWFRNTFLDTKDFNKEFPLTKCGFLEVPKFVIHKIDAACGQLFYENNQSDTGMPKYKFRRWHPAERVKGDVHIFFVYHSDDQHAMELWKHYIINGKTDYYPGLNEFACIAGHVLEGADICFENKDNPVPELIAALESPLYHNDNIKYLALYITPFKKEETRRQEIRIMPRVKEFFIERGITVQSAEPDTINLPGFHWSLTTMSTTIVAKLGGIPWRPQKMPSNELTIGIGAFKNTSDDVSYLGASVCFNNSGRLQTSDWFEKSNINDMAGYIATMVRKYATTYGNPERLTIHFYKKLKQREIELIEKKLQELKLPKPIPVYIVSINKTEETELVAFDYGKPTLMMPETGTYIELYDNKFLLFNNARIGETYNGSDHYHFPIKLHIQGNNLATINAATCKQLIAQVYLYSKLNYRTLAQQNMPMTLLAVDLMADFVPYFENKTIPEVAKAIPWWL